MDLQRLTTGGIRERHPNKACNGLQQGAYYEENTKDG
jgi:hypothetical protein